MNIIELLEKGSSELKLQNILSHKLDSEILLAKVLENSREKIIVNSKKEVNLREISEFTKLIKRRENRGERREKRDERRERRQERTEKK